MVFNVVFNMLTIYDLAVNPAAYSSIIKNSLKLESLYPASSRALAE
jgi:hypothetical protein